MNRNMSRKDDILLVITIIISILSIILIPLNLFVLEIPEYISIILSGIIFIFNIILWIKLNAKILIKVIISIIGLISIIILVLGTYCNPYWNSISLKDNSRYYSKNYNYVLTYDEAIKDLEYSIKYLRKVHPASYSNIPSDIQSKYNTIKDNLKKYDKITVSILNREIESMFSLLKDSHTYVKNIYRDKHFLKYIYKHNEDLDTLIKINEIDIDDLFKTNSIYYSYETKDDAKNSFYNDISTIEGLTYLGFNINDGIEYTYKNQNGTEEKYTFYKDDFLTYDDYATYNNIKDNSNENQSFVKYEIDKDNNIAILTLLECNNNQEYKNTIKNLFSDIKKNSITNLVVDLRNNGGGNSSVATEFLRYINVDSYKQWADEKRLGWFLVKNKQSIIKNQKHDEYLFNGNLYILTSSNTFSAAMNFAEYIKDNNIGTIIGEASLNDPNSYGDIAQFKLPSSNLYMQISTKKWHRIDNKEGLIEPDIKCDSKNALDKVYKIINY